MHVLFECPQKDNDGQMVSVLLCLFFQVFYIYLVPDMKECLDSRIYWPGFFNPLTLFVT